jgi:DNA-binding NarL/FixJ family response regulator
LEPIGEAADLEAGASALTPDAPIKVLIVDDHPLIQDGLQAMLAGHRDIELVGVSGTAESAVKLSALHSPDVVLMDFRLAGRTGAEAAADIRSAQPDTSIVFLSSDETDETLSTAVLAGASGYLAKTSPAPDVVDAIRRVAAGEMLIPARVLIGLLATDRSRTMAAAEADRLAGSITGRERQILQLTADGLDSAEIASALFIELSTVRWHVRNILEKLGVHSKLAAVARAAECGLVERRVRSTPSR